jgi:hypothetical protein
MLVAVKKLNPARLLVMDAFALIPGHQTQTVRQMLAEGLPRRVLPTLQHSGVRSANAESDLKFIPCLAPHMLAAAIELLVPSYEKEAVASGLGNIHVARLLTIYQHEWYGARFPATIYTRGCHYASHACSLEALACM